MIDNFDNSLKRDFDNFTVSAFDFNGRTGQGLRRFHASHRTAHALTVFSDKFDIVLIVERLQRRESFGNFHACFPDVLLEFGSSGLDAAFTQRVVLKAL